ncbi:MAG: tRNA (uracil-5-)-methyltransferase [Firmicutes bacterium]|nr:tRNA (uracil-5-)-methyltransferase [Bacillota bacterium]
MDKKKILKAIANIGILAVVMVVGFYVGSLVSNRNNDEGKTRIAGDSVEYAEDRDYSDIEESPNIAIPGYEKIVFKAGQTKQEVKLYNPKENTCYFKMSLVLDNSTIWTSDLLEPNKAFTEIELDKPLDVGLYKDVILKYDCFSLKDQSKLNGAEIKVDIEVK